jgi:hypothetical protein
MWCHVPEVSNPQIYLRQCTVSNIILYKGCSMIKQKYWQNYILIFDAFQIHHPNYLYVILATSPKPVL